MLKTQNIFRCTENTRSSPHFTSSATPGSERQKAASARIGTRRIGSGGLDDPLVQR